MNPSSILSFNYLLRFSLMAIVCMGIIFTLVDHWYPASRMDFSYHKKMRLFAQQKNEIEAIVLGTSHSLGFHFSSLGLKGLNFYDGGGDVDEAEFKFYIISEQSRKLNTVFIPVSPGSLQFSQLWAAKNTSQRQYRVIRNSPLSLWRYPLLWGEFLSDTIRDLIPLSDWGNGFRHDLLSLLRYWAGEELVSVRDVQCFFDMDMHDKVNFEDGIVGGYKRQLVNPACIRQYADETVTTHINDISLSLLAEPGIAERHLKTLLSMAKTLEQRQGRLVLVIPPLTREYYQDPRIQALLPEHFALLSRLAAHPNIEVYDFHDFFYEQMADGSNDYFYDDDHLALPGAIEFSKALRETMGL